jgi:hypothetical protein
MTCKTTASATTCASCWPGWYLDANTVCVICPEEFAYSGCYWDATANSNVGAVATANTDNAPTECPPGFAVDSDSTLSVAECKPCLGEGVAVCNTGDFSATSGTIGGSTKSADTTGAFDNCFEGFFFSGLGSYTRVSDVPTLSYINNGTAQDPQDHTEMCLMCPDECYE